MEKEKAPDGGYGWVIVFVSSSIFMIVVPIMTGFALLFRYVFQELQMSATDISSIINVNTAFGLLLGLFNGPLLKKFGFRKVAMVGGVLMSTGLALTSTATTFTEFIIYYGIINSVGFTTNMSSFYFAINTYFDKRRNLAIGLCTAISGFGNIIMPIVISFLIEAYGVRGTTLILAGLILNTLAGALLLHPVSWHYRIMRNEETTIEKEFELLNTPLTDTKVIISERQIEDGSEEEFDIDAMHGLEKAMISKKAMESGEDHFASKLSLYEEPPTATWGKKSKNSSIHHYTSQYSISKEEKKQSKKKSQKWITKLVELFDLDLLQDSGYQITWLGMSIAYAGEINFSLMTPLILGDKGWDVQETATLMSLLAFSDITMRFISPFIGDLTKLPVKQLYMISLMFLVITRSSYIRDKSENYTLCIYTINSLSLLTIILWTVDMIRTRQVTNTPDNQKKRVES